MNIIKDDLIQLNISDLEFTDRKPDFYRMTIDIEVRDVEHLMHVLTAVEADSDVAQVLRKNRKYQSD